ncbi:MAG: hypothetical protein ABWZ66_06525, partial [Pyrinomonadaceae bacterium]
SKGYERAAAVQAGSFTWFDFNYSETTRLYGRFRALGGKNDIECYILDDDGLENFKNGNQFRAYYASGRVTVATFDVTLAKGNYHLIFSNKWSVMTPKAVTIWFLE